MLQKLIIKNVALIDYVEINFAKGLNVLSGETGAGKSVIIESLNFVLGAKADKTLIRTGTAECFVQAVFDVANNLSIKNVFNAFDLEDDDSLIISRRFSNEGKNSIKVNGMVANVSMLKKITSHLVDVHGQSEHFYLLKTANQLNLIDKCGGDELKCIKDAIKTVYTDYKNITNQLDELGGDESQRLMRLDVLKYQVNEIENCNLKENEEEALIDIKQKLEHQERIFTAINTLKCCISDENGASDILSNAVRAIESISNLGQEFAEMAERIENVFSELNDISDSASNLLDDLDENEYDINFIEERLETIKNIKKKYGHNLGEINGFLYKAKEEIDKLENFNELSINLVLQKSEKEDILYELYIKLNNLRKTSAKNFTNNILSELKELGMPNANFEVSFSNLPNKNECKFNSLNGFDELEFYFSANNGEPLKPLSAVISGGEMSRFMLAIKTQTAKYNDISTFIFDEIDAGISGATARVVAEKFAKISKSVQIIAISHLPQISSMADNNLLISKIENENTTVTTVKSLTIDEKVSEIIRLIGGEVDSDSAILHAQELISQAEKFKKSI